MQSKKILLALDLFDDYQILLNRAMSTAKLMNTELHIVYVQPEPILLSDGLGMQPMIYMNEMRKAGVAELNKIHALHPSIVTHLLEGDAKTLITQLAQQLAVEFTMIGSHGKHGIQLLLGSTANGVLHLTKNDVLTIRVGEESKLSARHPYQRILVAADNTEEGRMILHKAKYLAKKYEAELYLICVLDVGEIATSFFATDLYKNLERETRSCMNIFMTEFQISASHSKLAYGKAKSEILQYAKETQADLIILGNHTRHGIPLVLLGSTANAVLQGASCDVYLVNVVSK